MRGTRALCGLATAAGLLVAGPAYAQVPDAAPPVVNAATLSPTPGLNNWYRSGPVTVNLSATDDVAVAKFEYSTNSGATFTDLPVASPGPSVTGSFQVTQEALGNNAVRYRAVDTAGKASTTRQISVRIDTRTPSIAWPGLTNGRVGRGVTLIPTRTDPSPGSGGVAIREMRLDGDTVYPLPVATSDLSVGGHELATLISDAAGNSAWYTQSFAVTTSFADVRSLLDGHVATGTLAEDTATELRAKLGEAEELAAAGDAEQAARALNQLDALVLAKVDARASRGILSGDVRYLVDGVRGRPHPEPELGLTSSPASPPEFIPDPVLSPLPHNPNTTFDVLVYSETTGFRHDHIPHTILAIQKLGAERGFNVDVYDPQLPTVSLPTSPFLSLEALQKYETIVFESTVGHTPGPLDPVTERPNMERYMQAGGGYVGLHGAADSARGNVLDQRWPWYGDLVGGWFTNHPGGQSGFGHCGSCIHTEVVTEDHEHPATAHLDDTWMTVDELYNFDRHVRTDVHTLLSLNEATYQRSLNSGNAATVPLTLMGGDHPIAWCQNWDGGKAFSNILGHARWQYYDASFMKIILGGIETTADQVDANCASYRETRLLVAGLAADGSITADAATAADDLLENAQTSYVAKEYTAAGASLNSLRNLAKERAAGSSAARAELLRQADALRDWMLALNAG